MAFQYKIIINDIKPVNQIAGTFWLHKTSGILFLFIDDFRQVAASETTMSSETDEIIWIDVIESGTEPVAPVACQIWVNSNNTVWVYLNKWIPICGA